MDRYRQVFPGRHTVLPVIHVESQEQALRNARIARDAGADGVFLISHGMMTSRALLELQAVVADAQPGWWVGVNCLSMKPDQVFAAVSPKVDGVWTDNAGIDEGKAEQPYPAKVAALQRERAPNCLYFGGVAFKYQREVEDVEAACKLASQYMDVVTTSGSGTGSAANVEKIQRMKQAMGTVPLAIASGITPENVGDYLPHADSFLVATGISLTFSELDPARTLALVKKVRAFSG